MQVGKDTAIRLVIVDDSVEDAEALVSGLRNAGIAVRPLRPESLEELATMLASQPIDLLLADHRCTTLTFPDVMQHVRASGKDLPVVAVVDGIDDAILLDIQDRGARGLVLRARTDHLQSVVRTEWSDLEARRGLRRLEAQVRETERRCDSLIESSRDPIAYVHEGMHIRANEAYLEMFGFEDFEEVEGMSLLDLVAPQHVAGFRELLKKMSKGEPPPPRYELEARGADGEAFPAVMEFMPASYDGEPCAQVVFRRQELDPELAREVEELRKRDQATGLYNRATFIHTLEGAVAEAAAGGRQHGLLLIEPDHYHRLLQDIGLDSSDRLIAALAERLRGSLDDTAVAARFGEHTLAVLLRGADHMATSAFAEHVRQAFSTHVFAVGDRSVSLTTSIGGVQIGERIASVSQVLAKASQGVQSSIGVGGDRVELFDPGAVDRAEEERIRAWVGRIRAAIDNDGFLLHYQPVISLQGEPEPIYEAYVRMSGGAGEMVPPLAFLQIAEEHGLLGEIDRWVISRAVQVIGERVREGQRTTLFVKVTQASLLDEAFAEHVRTELQTHGVPGALLVLELPEAKVFTHLRAAQAFQAAVGAFGCRVGLEQFGSGLNSFQLLAHFDPAFLKIDRAFIEDLSKHPEHQQKVRDIAARATEAGKQTIAEFVQDAASMSILFSSGVDYVQGHFLAAAGPEMTYEF